MILFDYSHSSKTTSNDDYKQKEPREFLFSGLCSRNMAEIPTKWQHSREDPALSLQALCRNCLVLLFSWTPIDTVL